ncbi:zinc-ribbon domain-containing protein [Corynebacterium stationis]
MFAQSHTRAIWTCATCSHTWEAKIQNRFLGTGCPQCRSSRNKK